MTNSDMFNAASPGDHYLAPRAGPARRILVVDPDHDLRRLYSDVLARPGYSVDLAVDGADGWKALQERNYDLLITEHELPKLTGIELVKNLRSARMDLPVVLAAASFPKWDITRDPTLELAGMLLKPFGIDVLLSIVDTALRPIEPPR